MDHADHPCPAHPPKRGNGSSWRAVGVSENNINAGKWHTRTTDGNIAGSKVPYLDFIVHGSKLARTSGRPSPSRRWPA
jgi:hypothetical protein